MKTLALIEMEGAEVAESSLQAITLARAIGEVDAVVVAADAEAGTELLGSFGVGVLHRLEHPMLDDYAPEAWADALRQLVEREAPDAVLAAGTERGNEVMAHLGAVTDLPMVANAVSITPGSVTWTVTRIRWGGSLLEEATVEATTKLLTMSPHAVTAETATTPTSPSVVSFAPSLDDRLARTKVKERVTLTAGITLATAPVVVSGGRGMGSAENFQLLEELAALVGGAVGCSRVATNNGWRSHSDQVGQTGTKVAPELYFACGISGAIQHWVGMMASKRVMAINTDAEAPMVTKSDYAVIGDAVEVVTAVIDEINRRKR